MLYSFWYSPFQMKLNWTPFCQEHMWCFPSVHGAKTMHWKIGNIQPSYRILWPFMTWIRIGNCQHLCRLLWPLYTIKSLKWNNLLSMIVEFRTKCTTIINVKLFLFQNPTIKVFSTTNPLQVWMALCRRELVVANTLVGFNGYKLISHSICTFHKKGVPKTWFYGFKKSQF